MPQCNLTTFACSRAVSLYSLTYGCCIGAVLLIFIVIRQETTELRSGAAATSKTGVGGAFGLAMTPGGRTSAGAPFARRLRLFAALQPYGNIPRDLAASARCRGSGGCLIP